MRDRADFNRSGLFYAVMAYEKTKRSALMRQVSCDGAGKPEGDDPRLGGEQGSVPLVVKRAKQKYLFRIENFCVMGNHFHLVNACYEAGPIIMTSNRTFAKWSELLSDEAVATAMLDRLLHHSLVFSLKGDSYRMKNRMKIGAVGFD